MTKISYHGDCRFFPNSTFLPFFFFYEWTADSICTYLETNGPLVNVPLFAVAEECECGLCFFPPFAILFVLYSIILFTWFSFFFCSFLFQIEAGNDLVMFFREHVILDYHHNKVDCRECLKLSFFSMLSWMIYINFLIIC